MITRTSIPKQVSRPNGQRKGCKAPPYAKKGYGPPLPRRK